MPKNLIIPRHLSQFLGFSIEDSTHTNLPLDYQINEPFLLGSSDGGRRPPLRLTVVIRDGITLCFNGLYSILLEVPQGATLSTLAYQARTILWALRIGGVFFGSGLHGARNSVARGVGSQQRSGTGNATDSRTSYAH